MNTPTPKKTPDIDHSRNLTTKFPGIIKPGAKATMKVVQLPPPGSAPAEAPAPKPVQPKTT